MASESKLGSDPVSSLISCSTCDKLLSPVVLFPHCGAEVILGLAGGAEAPGGFKNGVTLVKDICYTGDRSAGKPKG